MKLWLEEHAQALQGCAAAVTALAAVAALIGVKVQIDASAQLQREQSARDIYREYLNLSISKPEFADPDYCALKDSANAVAYEDYVEYLLYTAEQTVSASPDWEPTMMDSLARHRDYLCGQNDLHAGAPEIRDLIRRFRAQSCGALTRPACSADVRD
jgi:hypothetical protein